MVYPANATDANVLRCRVDAVVVYHMACACTYTQFTAMRICFYTYETKEIKPTGRLKDMSDETSTHTYLFHSNQDVGSISLAS